MLPTASTTNPATLPLRPDHVWDRSEIWLMLTAFCGACIIGLMLFYDVSLFAVTVSSNRGEPIATLANMRNGVKYRTADVPVWQSAARNMPIYKRDQIFTDANSRAEIKFNNAAGLSVDENSLIIVDLSEQKASLNLVRGSFTGKVNKAAGTLNITVGNRTTQITSANAQIALHKTKDDGIKLTVLEGKAQMLAGGQSVALSQNQVGEVSKAEPRIKVRTLPIFLQAPPRDVRHAVKTEVPTRFTWRSSEQTKRTYKFELANDQSFKNILSRIETQTTAVSLNNLQPGTYYWRVSAFNPTSNVADVSEERRLEVIRLQAPKLVNPQFEQTISYRPMGETRKGTYVALEWLSSSDAFIVELANDEAFRNTIWKTNTTDTRVVTQALPRGRYFWRIRSRERNMPMPWSETGIFNVRELAGLEAPANLRIVNMNQLNAQPTTNRIEFAWDPIKGAANYDLEISRDGQFARQGKNATLRKRLNKVNFTWQTNTRNNFFWRVKAVDESGFTHEASAEQLVEFKKPQQKPIVPVLPIVNTNPQPALLAANVPVLPTAPTPPASNELNLTGPVTATKALPQIAMTRPKDAKPKTIPKLPEPPPQKPPLNLLAPNLATPGTGERMRYAETPPEVSFSWEQVADADAYRFQLARNEDFSDLVTQQETTQLNYLQTIDKGRYYWRVQALGPDKAVSPWSKPAQLAMRHIPPLAIPETIAPPSEARITYRADLPEIAFRWTEVKNATRYKLQVAKDAEFNKLTIDRVVQDTRYIRQLASGDYHWRVRSLAQGGQASDWTEGNTLTIARSQSIPEVESPKGDAVVTVDASREITFSWNKISDADTYNVVVSKDQSFNKIDHREETTSTSLRIRLPANGKYYWYLEGRNKKENLVVRSTIESFRVRGPK